MKPEEYNPKAREAFGKTLIDVGVSITKGIVLLFTVVPTALIIKIIIEPEGVYEFKVLEVLNNGISIYLMIFIALSFLVGHFCRTEGLRHIHELENEKT